MWRKSHNSLRLAGASDGVVTFRIAETDAPLPNSGEDGTLEFAVVLTAFGASFGERSSAF